MYLLAAKSLFRLVVGASDVLKPVLRELQTHLGGTAEHFGLLPVRSGYLDAATLHPSFTTEYGPVYERIIENTLRGLDMADFEVLLPMDKVVVIRPFSLEVPQELF